MPIIRRSALVEHAATRMFDLVNDVAAYPRRFAWCDAAHILEQNDRVLVARLDLGLGSFRTWFTTENSLQRPDRIDMQLRDGPFKRLQGQWTFHGFNDHASKVSLMLDFEPASRLLGPALALGFQSLADRMVNDFVRVADREQT
ncbi:type II toxin-antitoxin system RatA family toxin [Xanthomonas sacchari]|uniref:type II toxin-antitoxin system RatA family toxin n=1 Tax=Xanthomonas sacchari TaxID=56458 RepID=UPI0035270B51